MAGFLWLVPIYSWPVLARRSKNSTGTNEGPDPKRGSEGVSSLGTSKLSNIMFPLMVNLLGHFSAIFDRILSEYE